MGETEVIRSSDKVYTREILNKEFTKLGLKPGMNLIIHSSLSKIGWVTGGPVTVIYSLMDVITEQGTIIMPAHSGNYSDPENWSNPPVPEDWIDDIKENMPAFNKEVTPTRGIGIIPEIFRTFPDVLRSYHPCFSFTAWGKNAEYVTKNHSLNFGLGDNSPLGKLYNLDGHILLLGVDYDRNTSFHLSEVRSEVREEFENEAPILVDGKRVWKSFKDISFNSDLFNEIGRDFEEENDIIEGKIGLATSKLFKQRKAVDFAKKWIKAKEANKEN
ncbi:MAG: AAC(3) family N-acetyltransferase [Halanaerobiales bacterium]|nr:AAC(3) family N-acetyltransferase [Halanaerobiales bacterium]